MSDWWDDVETELQARSEHAPDPWADSRRGRKPTSPHRRATGVPAAARRHTERWAASPTTDPDAGLTRGRSIGARRVRAPVPNRESSRSRHLPAPRTVRAVNAPEHPVTPSGRRSGHHLDCAADRSNRLLPPRAWSSWVAGVPRCRRSWLSVMPASWSWGRPPSASSRCTRIVEPARSSVASATPRRSCSLVCPMRPMPSPPRALLGGARTAGVAPPTDVVLTHPANWGEYKLDLLAATVASRRVRRHRAGQRTGSGGPAALRLHRPLVGGRAVAVYDFGGARSMPQVIRRRGRRCQRLAGFAAGPRALGRHRHRPGRVQPRGRDAGRCTRGARPQRPRGAQGAITAGSDSVHDCQGAAVRR